MNSSETSSRQNSAQALRASLRKASLSSLIERRADDADLGSQVGVGKVQEAGQQFAACQIPCGTEHYDDMRRRAGCLLLGPVGCRGVTHTFDRSQQRPYRNRTEAIAAPARKRPDGFRRYDA